MRLSILLAGVLALSSASANTPESPANLCIDDKCPSTSPSGTGSGSIKWHPGHYMLTYLGDSPELIVSKRIPEVCKEPALQGLQMRLEWSDLEKAKGSYDFATVDKAHDALASCGKRLILQVLAVDFNATSPTGFVPAYLLSDPEYNGGAAKTASGYIARLWEAPVMDRFIALSRALADTYDDKPNFEGVIFAETATSKVEDGYTAGAYITQLKRAIAAMEDAWPRTNVIVFNNFLQGSTDTQFIDFVRFLKDNRAVIAGPDVLPPPHNGSKGERIYRGELGGLDMRGQMPAMFAVQSPELGGKEGTFTPRELYDHCVVTNRCSHMFWIRNTAEGGAEQQWDTGLLPFIRANPKTVENCPRSYSACVK